MSRNGGMRVLVSADKQTAAELVTYLAELGVTEVVVAIQSGDWERELREFDAFIWGAPWDPALAAPLIQARNNAAGRLRFILIGSSPSIEAELVKQLGAQEYLPWPNSLERLRECLMAPDPTALFEHAARLLVGRVGLREAQEQLRRAMLRHALEIARGSRRLTARLLGVTRPAVQRMLKDPDYGDAPPASAVTRKGVSSAAGLGSSPLSDEETALRTGTRS